MIDNQTDTNNPVLTPEQTKAIEEAKTRLLNLENEISIATKNLKAIKAESERVTKEVVYQNDLLNETKSKLAIALVALSETEDKILAKTVELNSLSSDIKNQSTQAESKSTDLTEREKRIADREIQQNKTLEMLHLKVETLADKTDSFNKKVAKLKEVLSLF